MNHKILLIAFLQILCYLSFGQHQQLESLDETIIGPENVSLYFEEQVEYYLEKYLVFEQELEQKEEMDFKRIDELKKTKKDKRRNRNTIINLTKSIEGMRRDRSLLNEYKNLWSEFLGSEMNRKFENNQFAKSWRFSKFHAIENQMFSLGDLVNFMLLKIKWLDLLNSENLAYHLISAIH